MTKLEQQFRDIFKNHVVDSVPVERSETIGRMFEWLSNEVAKETRSHYYKNVELETRKKLIEEIIEDIPLCRDRITKCDCKDHDINNEIFDYLESLK